MKEYKEYLDWTVYQIYPRSFADSDGDGIGDMKGITQRLGYIRSLGVNAIWICPMYKSPQCDNGYDISDYRDFQKEYGTMSDFENLVEKAHALGIKVIMDLVANHTSDKHFWFEEGRKSRDNIYHDYYYWADKPRNDWKSVFGGSAWEYNEPTNEYYLHSFAIGQPDVNWTNPKVRKEFCDIVDFWVDKGVDGFRCDVLDYIAKDFEKGKMFNGPHFHEYVKELFGREKVKHIFTVGECQADESSIRELCGEGRGELKCSFQFEHFDVGRTNKYTPKDHSLSETASILKKWQEFSQKHDFLYTLLTDNHDQPWYNSRVGNDKEKRYESATLIATMVYALKGIPFIYQGQEMGAANSVFEEISSFDDIETVNYYKERRNELGRERLLAEINYGSRDNSRRPMAWNGEKTFGFTSAEKPWLPFATRSAEINVESDLSAEKSVIKYYRELFALREKHQAFRHGTFKDLTKGEGYFVYERALGEERFVVVCNFEKENKITDCITKGKLLLSNYGRTDGKVDRVYAPYEAAIYKLNE